MMITDIVGTTRFMVSVFNGHSGDIKGYFGASGNGEVAGKTIKDPNKEGPEYTIDKLYVNVSDQVVLQFKEGMVGLVTTINVTYELNDVCADPITVVLTHNGSDEYTGVDTSLFDAISFNDANTVTIELVQP